MVAAVSHLWSIPGASELHKSDLGSSRSSIQEQNQAAMEGPSAQSPMASPFGKGVEKEEEKQSLEVSTLSWDIPGCPRHWRAQNDSRHFLEIQFPSAAGWNDLKCPLFPYFLLIHPGLAAPG